MGPWASRRNQCLLPSGRRIAHGAHGFAPPRFKLDSPTDANRMDQVHMKSVVLIGTSHKYQLPGNPTEQEFRECLAQICEAFEVQAVAEEMSVEALAQKRASQSLCEQIANAKGIGHRYCDPNNEQRQTLHIRQEQDIRFEAFLNDWDNDRLEQEIRAAHAIREHHWLDKLLDLNCWPVLFVCGANHLKSFCGVLDANGLRAHVVTWDWPS
jgi:hypothetical protein